MRYTGLYGVLVLIAVACAVQNNPLPEDQPNDGEGGEADSGGSKATGGKPQTGGSVSTSGTASGGKEDSGGSMSEGGSLGGKAGASSGGKAGTGSAGKASGGGAGKSSGGAGGSSAGSGSGGKGGSGGSSSNGGSAGSGCKPTDSGPIAGISARYENEGSDDFGIGSKLIIANSGQNTINLNALKLRYYFTNEVQATLQTVLNWGYYRPNAGGAQVDKGSKISFALVPMTCKSASADTYFEFAFAADAGNLEPGYQIYFSWAAHNSASQKFTKTNDYSYDAAAKESADDTKIVVMQNSGTRVWGTEP